MSQFKFICSSIFAIVLFHINFAQNPTAPLERADNYSNNQILTQADWYQNESLEYLIYDKGISNLLLINRYDGTLECYDKDYKKKWEFIPEDKDRLSNARNEFYYQDGVIFTAYMTGYIYALDAKNGSQFWNAKIGMDKGELKLRGQSLKPYKNKIYLSSENSNVYAIDVSNGDFLWNYQLAYPYNHLPVLPLNDKVYMQNAPYMYNFEASSGKALYQRGFKKAMYGKPVTDGNLVIIADESSTVYGLSPDDMAPVWQFEIGEDYYNISKKIFTENQKVYFATESNEDFSGVYSLSSSDGKEIWHTQIKGDIAYIKNFGKNIYGYNDSNLLFVINMDNGKISKEFELKNQPVSNLEMQGNYLFFYSENGLVKFNLDNKKEEIVIPFQNKDKSSRLDSQILFVN